MSKIEKELSPKEKLDKVSFSNLVKAINEKWSHTYVDYVEEEGQGSNTQ